MDVEQRVDYCLTTYKSENKNDIKTLWIDEWLDNGPLKKDIIDKILLKYPHFARKEDIIETYRSVNTKLHLFFGVQNLLKSTHEKGVLQFLITNGNQVVQKQKISSLNISNCFEDIIIATGDYAKPSPECYLKLLAKYNICPKKCISVGDWYAIDGIVSAYCGIPFIYLKGGPITENVPNFIKKIESIIEIEEIIQESFDSI